MVAAQQNRQQQMQRTTLFALVVVCGATLSAAIGNEREANNRNSGATLVVYTTIVLSFDVTSKCKTCFRSCACSYNSCALLAFQFDSPARTRLPRSFPPAVCLLDFTHQFVWYTFSILTGNYFDSQVRPSPLLLRTKVPNHRCVSVDYQLKWFYFV